MPCDVPTNRLLPEPNPATDADLLRCLDREPKRLVELIDGRLVLKVCHFRDAVLTSWLGHKLSEHVVERRLGFLTGPDGPYRLAPGLIRLPDLSFTSWDTLPTRNAHLVSIADFAPDLAVELLSPGNTVAEMARKRRELFAAGTRLVWEFSADRETADVYADPARPDARTRLRPPDTLDGSDVLPGFRILVADVFAGYPRPDRTDGHALGGDQ